MITADFQCRRFIIMLRCFILLMVLGISSSIPTLTLLLGSQFKLQCHPGYDLISPEYSWSFTNHGMDRYSPMDNKNEELELNPVDYHHNGTFKCVAKGINEKGMMKIKRIFTIKVIESPVIIAWKLIEGNEGEPAILSCTSSYEKVDSFHSANITWYKIKEVESRFELQKFKPDVRIQGSDKEKEKQARHFYWASDLTEPDWSIEINSLELDDGALYRCDISSELYKEQHLMELVVTPAPPPRCLNDSQQWEACAGSDKSSEAILQESLTEFSFQLYKHLNKMQPESNLLFSPISIAVLFSHLLLGTRGTTRSGLEQGLSLPVDFTCIHAEMKKLRDKMKNSILVANQIFYNPRLKLLETFINQSQEFYDSVPEKLTNNNQANVERINEWVSNRTQNRITELVDHTDESVEFILLNAVYFIGKWKGTFEVKTGQFTTFSGEVLTIPTLYSANYNLATTYIRDLKAHVAKFTLTGKNSLYILLPHTETRKDLQYIEDKLDTSTIQAIVTEMASVAPITSEVILPKVKFLVNTDLGTFLRKRELHGLFDDPNLCGIFSQSDATPLSDARHHAFLSLTEKGVEAAAASSVLLSRSFSSFSAMQPFVLMVLNEETHSPLFLGRLLHPLKKE